MYLVHYIYIHTTIRAITNCQFTPKQNAASDLILFGTVHLLRFEKHAHGNIILFWHFGNYLLYVANNMFDIKSNGSFMIQ